jgi:aryl-alcohol dehydrogenase-like predicted oxidoreductase
MGSYCIGSLVKGGSALPVSQSPKSRNQGECNPKAKMTARLVSELRKLARSRSETPAQLANRYGLNVSTVYRIIHRKIWN